MHAMTIKVVWLFKLRRYCSPLWFIFESLSDCYHDVFLLLAFLLFQKERVAEAFDKIGVVLNIVEERFRSSGGEYLVGKVGPISDVITEIFDGTWCVDEAKPSKHKLDKFHWSLLLRVKPSALLCLS